MQISIFEMQISAFQKQISACQLEISAFVVEYRYLYLLHFCEANISLADFYIHTVHRIQMPIWAHTNRREDPGHITGM